MVMSRPESFDPVNTPVERFIRPAWTVRDQAPASDAADLLQRAPQRVLYVTHGDTKRLIGVITRCDLDKFRRPQRPEAARELGTMAASDVEIVALKPSTGVLAALQVMAGRNDIAKSFDVLPVVSQAYELLGAVSRSDLEQALSRPPGLSSSGQMSY